VRAVCGRIRSLDYRIKKQSPQVARSTERLAFNNNNRKSQDLDDVSPAGVAFDILFTLVVPWRRLIE
jgi:hypothetical protein